jgi:ABC-2 type transport system ATP-binding protein
MIEVKGLNHSFGPRQVLFDLSFNIEAGEVFGLLGPNGAGKTTSIRILNGILKATSGDLRVLGKNPATDGAEIRRQAGVLTETPAIYERLTARQNLMFFGRMAGLPESTLAARVDSTLRDFDLYDRADDLTGGYSKGMKQRLALARALLANPQLLFLDEPTSGLDPEAAQHVNQIIESISHSDGHTVLLCTHNLDEAQRLCDRVAVLNSGRLLAMGSLAELSRSLWPGKWVDIDLADPLPGDFLRQVNGVIKSEISPSGFRVQVASEELIPSLVAAIVDHRGRIMRVNPHETTLEEIYFTLQQKQEGRQ